MRRGVLTLTVPVVDLMRRRAGRGFDREASFRSMSTFMEPTCVVRLRES